MSKTLFDHAEYELKKLDLLSDDSPDSRKILTDTLSLVRRFERMSSPNVGGNPHTTKWVLEFFETICNWLPLSPITDQPDEWEEYEDIHRNMKTGGEEKTIRWVSTRAPSIISMDGGKTWVDYRTNKEGVSVDHIKQAEEWAADKAERKANKEAVESQAKPPADPGIDTSTPPGEDSPLPPPASAEPLSMEAESEVKIAPNKKPKKTTK